MSPENPVLTPEESAVVSELTVLGRQENGVVEGGRDPGEQIGEAVEEREAQRRGITLEDARYQIEMLLQPPAPLTIDRACTLGDGIARISDAEHDELLKLHHEAAQSGGCHWFVPASGAASRM